MKCKMLLCILFMFIFIKINIHAQGTAINTSGALPDPSAMLDVSALNKGVLIPRMTLAQRNMILAPATGLIIYQVDQDTGFYYNAGSPSSPIWLQLMPNPANTELNMNFKKIVNLATCTDNNDAANKQYVDNAISAGGGNSSIPTMISDESITDYTFAEAVQYCENLNEGGYTDWRLPEVNEIAYFAGSTTSTNFLWTKTIAEGKENPINQNYISYRLSDGKWKNGGEITGMLLARTVSGNTKNDSWTTVATLTPVISGNLIIPTHIKFTGSRSSDSPCCQASSFRLKFNLADGSSSYSSVFTASTSATTFVDMQSIPLLTSITPFVSIEIEIKSYSTTVTSYATLVISGYEIQPTQQDGNKMFVKCL